MDAVSHVDGESRKKQQNESVFSAFGTLFSDKGRNGRHFAHLVNLIGDGSVKIGSVGNLQYSVRRFVRGLASAHLYPQCASFAGLSCLLKYELATAEEVLDVLDAEMRGDHTASEVGTLNAGCVLTCGAVLQSGIFGDLSTETKRNIVNKLITAGKTKSYLATVTHKFLVELVETANEEDFKDVVWPACKKEMKPSLALDGDVNDYDFLLVCHARFPEVVNKFITKIAGSLDSFVEKFATSIVKDHAHHEEATYDRLCQTLVQNKKHLQKLWIKVVDGVGESKSYFRDKTVVLLFHFILKNLREETVIPKLLVPKFIDMLIMILSFRKTKKQSDENDAHSWAKSSLDLLVQSLAREGVSNSVRFKTIEKLMFYPANMKFEKKTGTKCIQSLIMHLDGDSLKQLSSVHREIITGELKKTVDEDGTTEDWNNNERQYVMHIFVKFLNHPSVKNDKEWKLEQIKFVFDLGFIKNVKLHSSVQKCARECFYKAIEVQMSSLEDVTDLLDELVVHINSKIESGDAELSEKPSKSWNAMFKTIQEMKKSNDRLFIAVHLLLIHMGLQLFADSNLASFNIEELLMCYARLKNAHQKKGGNDGDEDLHWTEVTVDLMLSLLSRDNKLWRYVVCNLVFPQIVKHITPAALNQIIDVLNPKSGSRILNDDVSDASDGEDDDDDENENENEEEEEEDNDGKSESSLSESENEDDNLTLNDQFRSVIKDALGMSAALTDQESVDMDDMDEEEERRLNDRLSAAFRMFRPNSDKRNKRQTKEEKALMHFRFRVLDLVEMFVANCPSVSGCFALLAPLFDLLELSIKDPNLRILQHRVDAIIKKLASVKKFSNADDVGQDAILEQFEALLNRREVQSMVFVEMSPRISECCALLLRCSQIVPNPSPEVPLISNYTSLLDSFFHSRDNKLPVTLFQTVLRSSWPGNWKMVSTLFDLLVDPAIKLFKKMKIVELLDVFYKNSKLHAAAPRSALQDLNKVENEFVARFVDYQTEYEKKKVKTNEKMFLAFFSKVLSLVMIAHQSFKRHRSEMKKPPQWRKLVAKMTESSVVLTNRKSKRQLTALANMFDVKMPETAPRQRTSSDDREEPEEEAEEEEGEAKPEESAQKKRKSKTLSAEKAKKKKESMRLREAAFNDGIDAAIPFSSVDCYAIPEEDEEDEAEAAEEEEESEEERPKPKKVKKRKATDMNGDAKPSKMAHR